MKLAILALTTSIIIAAVAAWFSIIGLMAIFSGAALSIAIYASAIEIGKLVTASFLKSKWTILPNVLRVPMCVMVAILMFITSMGTFGYLSKAHASQYATIEPTILKLERLDQEIARDQKVIDDSTKVINQLDTGVDKLMNNDRIRGGQGAISIRKSQVNERKDLNAKIANSQANIDKMLDEELTMKQSMQQFEADVGPVRYLAELIYGSSQRDILEKTVRFVIILLVIVFDPLAIVLLLAANHVLNIEKTNKEVNSNRDDVSNIVVNTEQTKKSARKRPRQQSETTADAVTTEIPSPKRMPVRPIN